MSAPLSSAQGDGRDDAASQDDDDALLLPMVHQVCIAHMIRFSPPARTHSSTHSILSHPTQVGGHRAATEEEPPYMLRLRPHFVLKIVQSGPRGERELAFYRRLFPQHEDAAAAAATAAATDAGDGGGEVDEEGSVVFLRGFVPRFHGVRTVPRHTATSLTAFKSIDSTKKNLKTQIHMYT
jgi:hypothetical protein